MQRTRMSRRAAWAGLAAAFLAPEPRTWAAEPPAPAKPAETRELMTPLPQGAPLEGGNVMPIDWPTVLELARASNTEIALAAEHVREANVQIDLARQQWVPSLKIGTTLLHHEGRVQDIPGNIFDASKSSLFAGGLVNMNFDPQTVAIDVLRAKQKASAQNGALDRTTRDTLQEASLAYVDLIAAQGGAAITLEVAEMIDELLERSKQLLTQGVGTQIDVLRNQAQASAQLQNLNKARQNQLAASAQLVQLLNLETPVRLTAADAQLTPWTLIDENKPEEELIAQAHSQGPGLSEIAALLIAFDEQERQLKRLVYLPILGVNVGGGTFGGGMGGSYQNFNGSSDYGVNVYWDASRLIGTGKKKELFQSKKRQAGLQHQQLLAKLSAGVVVSRDTAIKARERIRLAETEIAIAIESYKLSKARLDAAETLSMEVLQAIASLGSARGNYLSAVIDYNKAQIRLQYLIGFANCTMPPAPSAPVLPLRSAPPVVEPGLPPIESVPAEVEARVLPPIDALATP